jgi:hypothetical protein
MSHFLCYRYDFTVTGPLNEVYLDALSPLLVCDSEIYRFAEIRCKVRRTEEGSRSWDRFLVTSPPTTGEGKERRERNVERGGYSTF